MCTLALLDQTLADLGSRPPAQLDTASLQRLKELEWMLKDVEKDVKKAHKSIKESMDKSKKAKGR